MLKNQQETLEVKLKDLQGELDDLRARWPAHSVKPEMIIQLEDLEEEIATLKNLLDEDKKR